MNPSRRQTTGQQGRVLLGVLMRMAVFIASLGLSFLALSAPPGAAAAVTHFTNIPAQRLGPALRALAKDRGFQIVYSSKDVAQLETAGAAGELTTDEALTRLLSGTGLSYRHLDANTITVEPAVLTDSVRAEPSAASQQPAQIDPTRSHLQLAQVDRDPDPHTSAMVNNASSGTQGNRAALEEIVVTAQKREQRLEDVPVPVTSISADPLVNGNLFKLQDYYSSVPGLSLTPDDNGGAFLTIRGISTGFGTNPAVGVMIDDIPFGASNTTNDVFLAVAPEVDPGDLARIEVLRGPQGTLYGAASMGGLLKYVTKDPSTTDLSGSLQAGGSAIHNGDKAGYSLRGSINIPVSDTLAIRASAFTREDPGYIDNLETGRRGVNSQRFDGARIATLWRPSQDMSLKLTALLQRSKSDGSSYADAGLGDLQQNSAAGTGQYHRDVQAYSAIFKARLGAVDLISLSGYSSNSIRDSIDLSGFFDFPGGTQDQFGVAGTAELDHVRNSKFTEELRLSSRGGEHLEWLFGGFFDYERSTFSTTIAALEPATGAQAGHWLDQSGSPAPYREYSAFADVTWHFTDRFEVQVGGRESQIRQTSGASVGTGPYIEIFAGGVSPQYTPGVDFSGHAFTYLLTPEFHITPNLMSYARLASGYRPGGPNNPIAVSAGFPSYKSDKTDNYEIGIKGAALERRLSFDASLYYIKWRDIQLSFFDPENLQSYNSNGSGARSQGVELSLTTRPVRGLTLSAWIEINDAQLTAALPAAALSYGVSGDRLPFSSRFSGNLSLDDEFPLTGQLSGFVGATLSYMGNREGVFASASDPTHARQLYGGYARADIRAGVSYDSWRVDLAMTNVTDRRAPLTGGLGTDFPNSFYYIPPRLVSLSIAKNF